VNEVVGKKASQLLLVKFFSKKNKKSFSEKTKKQ